jgi:acyl-CoA synthetase (NDP forming)/RimJ/RimL family protein N-acetyltransferase
MPDTATTPPADGGDVDFHAILTNGNLVHLRPPVAADRAALLALHDGLSETSAYFRYFSLSRQAGATHVDHLLGAAEDSRVRPGDLASLIALIGEEVAGLASYERLPTGDEAEVALLVDDEHQGLGIGTLLLEALAVHATANGVARLVAEVLPNNASMLNVFRSAGFTAHTRYSDGTVHVDFPLARTAALLDAAGERERAAAAQSITRLLAPASIAVIGAGRTGGMGHDLVQSLTDGGFRGRLYPVNPNAKTVCGRPAVATAADLPPGVDLAFVAVPADRVLEVVGNCATAGVHNLVVVASGFSETGAIGEHVERQLVVLARRAGMRVVGPNCLGIVNTAPSVRMNATVVGARPLPGRLGMMSQSGALGTTMLDAAIQRGVGLSTFVSVGNKADVSSNDLLLYWEQDAATDVAALYIDSFGNPRKFGRIARRVARRKPVLVIKPGRGAAGPGPTHSPTARDRVATEDALFTQAGVLRVDSVPQLLAVADVLLSAPLPAGRRVAVLGNSRSVGVLAGDACLTGGLEVSTLRQDTQAALQACAPKSTVVANPVDLTAAAGPAEYQAALAVLLAAEEVDAVLVVHTTLLLGGHDEVAAAVEAATIGATKPTLASYVGGGLAATDVATRGGVPAFDYPEAAAAALAAATDYALWQRQPEGELPSLTDVQPVAARRRLRKEWVERPGGCWVPHAVVGEVLSDYGVPWLSGHVVRSPAQAAEWADSLGGPVALRALNPDLGADPERDAVRRWLPDGKAAWEAYAELATGLGAEMGGGAVVRPMTSGGTGLIISVTQDWLFGPVIMLALGGTTGQLIGDRAHRLLPLTDLDADRLIGALRCSPLLFGYAGRPRADVGALANVLLRVAALAEDLAQVAELTLDPVVVSAEGATVGDARMRIAPPEPQPSVWLPRLAALEEGTGLHDRD